MLVQLCVALAQLLLPLLLRPKAVAALLLLLTTEAGAAAAAETPEAGWGWSCG